MGAHHQNGIIERYIQDITGSGRTLLLHVKRHWPDVIGTILWPFALKAAEDRRNHLKLDENGLAPINKFSRTFVLIDIKSWHPWGCPVFVLDKRAQSGCIPKWEPKARVGVYLGHSPCHAGSGALVLNPKTIHVSPQYYVVFDDNFSTVPFMKNGEIPPHWTALVKYNSESATDDTIDLANTWAAGTSDCEGDQVDPNLALTRSFPDNAIIPPSSDTTSTKIVTFEEPNSELSGVVDTELSVSDPVKVPLPSVATDDSLFMPAVGNIDTMTSHRSRRTPKPSAIVLENNRQQEEITASM